MDLIPLAGKARTSLTLCMLAFHIFDLCYSLLGSLPVLLRVSLRLRLRITSELVESIPNGNGYPFRRSLAPPILGRYSFSFRLLTPIVFNRIRTYMLRNVLFSNESPH